MAKKTVAATSSSYVVLASMAEARKYFVLGLHMRTIVLVLQLKMAPKKINRANFELKECKTKIWKLWQKLMFDFSSRTKKSGITCLFTCLWGYNTKLLLRGKINEFILQ